MTAAELKEISLKTSLAEFEQVSAKLFEAAGNGELHCDFRSLKPATIVQLEKQGFKIMRTALDGHQAYDSNGNSVSGYKVSFA